jgi:phosphoribosylaminoimidazole carboxylase (NCAIR synthetase)
MLLCVGVKRGLSHREEHRLRVFENRVLTKIFVLKRGKVTEEWRRLHNELHDLSSSPNIIWVLKSRRMKWAGHGHILVRREV